MSAFLKPVVDAVRARRIRWRVIPCGGRRWAYDAFADALEQEPDALNILLVDSEDPVAVTVLPWDHVKQREGDKWDRPASAGDTHLQMMVACMEAWFLADPEGLKAHFGGNFDAAKLPPANLAESRTKADIETALRQATRNTKAKQYRKIRDGARLLETIDSVTVRRHCQWCDRLFAALGKAIGAEV